MRKGQRALPLYEKSVDDVRFLSDVLLVIKNIPVKSRLSDFHFVPRGDNIFYEGAALSSEAKAMGYQVLETQPIEYYRVGHGDMYVGIQRFSQQGSGQRKANRSASYVFLLGNEKYSIDVELTYRDSSGYVQVNKDSILRLLRSANFDADVENGVSNE